MWPGLPAPQRGSDNPESLVSPPGAVPAPEYREGEAAACPPSLPLTPGGLEQGVRWAASSAGAASVHCDPPGGISSRDHRACCSLLPTLLIKNPVAKPLQGYFFFIFFFEHLCLCGTGSACHGQLGVCQLPCPALLHTSLVGLGSVLTPVVPCSVPVLLCDTYLLKQPEHALV